MTVSSLTVGIIKQAVDTLAVYPPSLPTMPTILDPTRFPYFIASTKFGLIFFSKLPPPTERINNKSSFDNLLIFQY